MIVKLTCAYCGKIFYRNKYNVRCSKNFCDLNCSGLFHRKVIIIECVICHKKFQYKPGKGKKHCSRKCMGKGKRKRIRVNCSTCGRFIYILHSRKKNYKRFYCNKICKYKKRYIKFKCDNCGRFKTLQKGEYEFRVKNQQYMFCSPKCNVLFRRKPSERKCLHCGKGLTNQQTKYCSKKCMNKYHYLHVRTDKICKVCGKKYLVPTYSNIYKASKYCSPECMASAFYKSAESTIDITPEEFLNKAKQFVGT